ncbi:MAG: DUF302 domain-containing protein [Gammaproteobacteria bacterium]|nr:DUF302 domain-containing protein [Gammaproteobacteria bacterium]
MKPITIALSVLVFALASHVHAAAGLVTMSSAHGVGATVDRLERSLEGAGFKIFARVNHGAGAKSVNLELADTELLIFGKPQAGTLLMQSSRTVGIDLPLKYLVWQDADGQVTIGWNDPAWLAERHGISDRGAVVGKIQGALRKFASEAAEP